MTTKDQQREESSRKRLEQLQRQRAAREALATGIYDERPPTDEQAVLKKLETINRWHITQLLKLLDQARSDAIGEAVEWLEADLKRLDSRNWTMDTLALDVIVGSGKADKYKKMKHTQIVVDRRAAHALYAILSNYKKQQLKTKSQKK